VVGPKPAAPEAARTAAADLHVRNAGVDVPVPPAEVELTMMAVAAVMH
jgi:hypothetical protein